MVKVSTFKRNIRPFSKSEVLFFFLYTYFFNKYTNFITKSLLLYDILYFQYFKKFYYFIFYIIIIIR
ncbi:hypothetical protein GLOIN_2v1705214 [Rhizophagus irregularis DAOM 181602=DAOM 197198]|uniref:Uncharacterized protein n=1 Tax=Rhizophagus irregularis (strain DAOM 181602 / DAOM 197198 / MUCL 43194) TaxID=747089 RepID=A0A2P4P793_RHIID|nr:hypothetical protein GLOIN_2v1705214 [Rhizophagus irregularis DAOM 181602=DAOM 197198]POG61251.1 hypothetical protein GLOIN_2v1705214 [Rhizophagus irregularis DAOM 181602=DAOM 197198]GET56688.1 hypothetical protein GLOIN_2v1705214 [Rhizophagus irregularis DAOM 181602=DAOM 197198]|eukprot:XP_025168117.1 hypothetical protein GLOIN_2v1705214 [Rhizophagus irregularis DAOM 181602=DAOM 197198]